jgi:hypothetical protein
MLLLETNPLPLVIAITNQKIIGRKSIFFLKRRKSILPTLQNSHSLLVFLTQVSLFVYSFWVGVHLHTFSSKQVYVLSFFFFFSSGDKLEL